VIDSLFVRLNDQKNIPWNRRLVDPPRHSIPRTLNEISFEYRKRLVDAINNKSIVLEEVDTCYCGTQLTEKLSSIDRFGLHFSTLICKECGLISTSPRISKGSLSYYYDKIYHPLHFGVESLSDKKALFTANQGVKILESILPFLEANRSYSLLEIGAGTGSNLIDIENTAREKRIEIKGLGTELSQECIEIARSRGGNVVYGSFDEIIKMNRKFDIIILSHVFEHFINLDDSIFKIRQLLSDYGLIYIEVPGVMVLHKNGQYNYDYLQYLTHAHIYHFNLASLTRIFNNNGFRLVQGNENVEAVYQNGKQKIYLEENYSVLLQFLKFMESNYIYFQSTKQKIIEKDNAIESYKGLVKIRNSILNSRRKLIIYTIRKLLNKSIQIDNF